VELERINRSAHCLERSLTCVSILGLGFISPSQSLLCIPIVGVVGFDPLQSPESFGRAYLLLNSVYELAWWVQLHIGSSNRELLYIDPRP